MAPRATSVPVRPELNFANRILIPFSRNVSPKVKFVLIRSGSSETQYWAGNYGAIISGTGLWATFSDTPMFYTTFQNPLSLGTHIPTQSLLFLITFCLVAGQISYSPRKLIGVVPWNSSFLIFAPNSYVVYNESTNIYDPPVNLVEAKHWKPDPRMCGAIVFCES